MIEVVNEMLVDYRKHREQLLQNLYVADGAVQALEQLLKRLENKKLEETKQSLAKPGESALEIIGDK